MKLAITIALLSSVLAGQAAVAGILEQVAGTTKIESVTIAASAKATVEGRISELKPVGAGLRTKKVATFNVKIYVAQLLASNPEKFVRTSEGALASLKDSKTVAIHLTLVRSLDADQVMNSFKEALAANNVNTSGSSIQAFLALAQTDAPSGKTVTIVGEQLVDGSEILTVETPAGNVSSVKGSKGFIKDVFSIWLGTPADSGLAKLKDALVGAAK
jgi:hypothetical protein